MSQSNLRLTSIASLSANSRNQPSRQNSTSGSGGGSKKRDRQSQLDFGSSTATSSSSTPAAGNSASDPKRRKLLTDSSDTTMTDRMDIDDQPKSSSTNNVTIAAARRKAHSPTPKKKMVIKPFKVKPQLAATFEEDTSVKLTTAVEAVYAKKSIEMSQEELYRAVEALCIHNKAPMLYEKLVQQCERHIALLLQELAEELNNSDHSLSLTSSAASSSSSSVTSPTSSSSSSTSLSLPFLQHMQSIWSAHCEEMIIIRGIFLYLDRTYVIQLAANAPTLNNNANSMNDENHNSSSNLPPPKSLWDMGLGLFCQQLKKHPAVESKVIHGLLALIDRERSGETVNRTLLKNLLRMFTSLKLYASAFQPLFLQHTQSFYQTESQRTIATSTPIEYIHYIQHRLQQEDDRALAYLDESTHTPLIHLIEQVLIQAHMEHMLGGGLKQLLDQKRLSELQIMYGLFQRIKSLDQLKEKFGAYVKQTATEIVQSGSQDTGTSEEPTTATPAPSAASPAPQSGISTPATMIVDLLKLKLTLDEIMSYAFASNPDYVYALKLAFDAALNAVENKPAELVAKFIDKVLRTGGKGIKITSTATPTGMDESTSNGSSSLISSSSASVGGEEVESLLDSVMFLFRYIHGKDVFQAFYKKDLAKRLLLQKSASVDAEKSMITKIKNECGASFTTKLEGMFKDIELSKETQHEYEQHRAEQQKAAAASSTSAASEEPLDLSVQVLTTGSWPPYTPIECTLPKDVQRAHEDFKLFYLNKHSGRKLIWHHSLATAILRAHFPKVRKELAVSGMQAIVLMLFNDHERLSMDEIGRYAGLTDAMELKRTLASLTFSEDVRILRKEPANKKLQPTDIFFINKDFTHKLFRIKINTVQMKETKDEQKSTTTRVFEDRQYALDAAIVRIMKSRKTLSHQLLIMEVIQQIKFPTTPADIKRRIASLIEREYMERDKSDSSVRYTHTLRE